jgi:hypothetical protein
MQKWPLLLLLLTLVGSALAAVGIGPAQIDLNFDSSSEPQTVTLFAINLGDAQIRVQISTDGDLASYVTFDSTNFLLGAGETKPVKATVDIPEDYAKGIYEIYINVAEVPVEETGTGYSVQSVSSAVVNVNKITGAAVLEQPQNQTVVQTQTTGVAQNQTNITQSPGGFVILPPKQISPFEKFTGSFASFLSPFTLRLSRLTDVQWLIIGLFAMVMVLLVVYLKEPSGQPQQPQLFAYQPQPPRYYPPPNYYPQQPRNDYRYGK